VKERKRILLIDNNAVESARRSVFRALAERYEFDVHLVVPRSWKEQGEVIQWERESTGNLQVHPTRFIFGYRQHRVVYLELFKYLRFLTPDLLYVDTEPENYAALEALLSVRLMSPTTKLVLVSSRTIDHRLVGFPYRFSWTHRACDSIIRSHGVDLMFVRPRSSVDFVAAYARRVLVLPFPVDCSMFRRSEKREPGETDVITVGFLGRLVEGKGVHMLLEALPALPPNGRLLIVGSGPMKNHLMEIAKSRDVVARVRFLPAVPYERVPGILDLMDILVLPSLPSKYWMEQCPRVLIEGMACEVPLLASDSAGIPDVVGDAGLLFRTGSVNDLVLKLRLLIEDRNLRADLQKRGRDRALALYDVPVVAEQMARGFSDCLSSA
jgi:glycosyltransferase involved in cell wall biosynthesis